MEEKGMQAYRRKLEAKLDEMKAELDKVQARINEAKADTEVNYIKRLEDLRSKRNDLQQRLSGVRDTAESTWKDMKTTLDESWDRLREEANELKSNLSIIDTD